MHAIVSLLDPQHETLVTGLWRGLEEKCGLSGVRITPFPHFTWQIVPEYKLDRLYPVLQELTASLQPFRVQTNGLGIFTGEVPVLYIPLVKDAHLLQLHARLWLVTMSSAPGASPYYDPGSWVPHITLAYGDVTPSRLSCAIEALAFQLFNWQLLVDHLAVIYQEPDGTSRVKKLFRLGEGA